VEFENSIESLANSFGQALNDALIRYEELRNSDNVSERKGKLSNIYVSFLLSGVLCNTPWLRIDLYDENSITDTIECFSNWDVQCISKNLYQRADLLAAQQYEKENIRVTDYELEQIWLNLSGEYFEGFKNYMPQILSQCETAQDIDCNWHYGHLLGRTVFIKEP
jgi:hypothetical protein